MYLLKFYVFLIFIIFFFTPNAKDFDTYSFTCADEIGPLIKFKIPDFQKNNEEEIFFNMFQKEDRTSNLKIGGSIKKLSHPIDDTYSFYVIDYIKDKIKIKRYIEFYPPSHLLIKKQEKQYESLVCWIPE